MRASGLVHLCNHIVHRAPGQIVECGAGASTVLLARLLAQRGTGRLTASSTTRAGRRAWRTSCTASSSPTSRGSCSPRWAPGRTGGMPPPASGVCPRRSSS
jgi:hypothetical protein